MQFDIFSYFFESGDSENKSFLELQASMPVHFGSKWRHLTSKTAGNPERHHLEAVIFNSARHGIENVSSAWNPKRQLGSNVF